MIPDPVAGQLIETQYLDGNIKRLKDQADFIKDFSNKDIKTVEEVAKKFEQIFIFYMLKTMRASIQKSGLIDGGRGEEIYTSMLDNEFSSVISNRGGIGLARLIIDDLKIRGLLKEYENKEIQGMGSFILPAQGKISSPFGMRDDPIDGVKRFHYGIDIDSIYSNKIFAAQSGKVIFSGEKGNYGKTIIIRHKEGTETLYAHNSKNLVDVGEYVKKREPIAQVGDSGRSTGPHLHFEIRRNGELLNPLKFL
ncbi:MAG TPA: peptidoglycan DD-metalloendopeptidase family protein [Nitrospinota bacterium]|nr:peptidoglycan DD-metalloendopeptidase family protein [Nitrospinota bacterium]